MNIKLCCTTLAILLHGSLSFSQTFNDVEYVDVGNINAAVCLHGDLNWNPATQKPACEYPKGSGKNVSFLTSLWMASYDEQAQLRASAQMYRQSGNDFWPGPLNENGVLDMTTSTQWARIWKVSFGDVNGHLANLTHTKTNTPKDILEWPAKGNPYAKGKAGATLSVTKDMAPFIDVNSDGIYNPLDGDYPDMKGDQMLWWVFSDNGPTRDNTFTPALEVEVHAKAYAYKRGTLLDNVVYYELDILNRSGWKYPAFRMGIFADVDLGYFGDDYIGFDSTRRLGYVYNGKPIDGTGQPEAYGAAPPMAGYTLLDIPGDNGSSKVPTGSFMTFNNDNTTSGNPKNGIEFSNYMQSKFRDGVHLKNDYAGAGTISSGRGAGPDAMYLFDGDPANPLEWSECASINPVGDRRMVLATNDYAFMGKSSAKVAFALVVADTGSNNACPNVDITNIKTVTDTAWKYYHNPPKPFVSVDAITAGKALGIYPNPANDIVYVSAAFDMSRSGAELVIYDAVGHKMNTNYAAKDGKLEVDIKNLPSGVYHIMYMNGTVYQSGRFVKE